MVKTTTKKVPSKKRKISFELFRPKSILTSGEEQISIPATALSRQTKQQLPLTGRLPYFIENWQNITQDSAILDIVQGFQIQFQSFPVQKTLPRSSLQNCKLVNEEIETLLHKGAIKRVPFDDQAFYHRMFLVSKKGGGQRPVLDLSPLNKFIPTEHFKMENLMTIKAIINKGDYMINIDLTDAYLTVPMHPDSQKFLRFLWQGQSYQFVTMPFGLNVAPRVFTKLMKPVIAWLRGQGVRMIIFLDDILILAPTVETMNQHARMTISLLESLGFLINYKKSTLVPTQRILFLGMLIDSTTMEFILPTEKSENIQRECRNLLKTQQPSIRQISRVLGLLEFTRPAIWSAPLHYRHIQLLQIESLRRTCDFDTQVNLSRGEIRLDLVDKQSTITERKSYSPSDSRFDNLFGCIQNRMGSIMGDSSNRRPMEHSRVPGAYKHPGAQGSFLCPEVVYEGSEQEGDLSQNRQLDCSSISEQQGRYPLPSVTPLDTGDMEVVRDQTPLSFSSTCSRQEQCNCGRGISQNERPQRLEDRFDGYSAPNQGVPNRSLCVSPDTSTEQIRQLAARSGCDPCGRVHNELDKFDSVRFSAIQPNSRRPSQDQEGNGNIDIDCASMVSSTMVASVDRLSNRLPCLPGEQFKSPDRRIPPKDNPSSIPGSKIGRVENIRRHFETAGLSTTAINLLTKSVKTSTTKAYNCSWSQWSSWCEKRESHPVLAPVSEVLTFLAEQFAEGKQYRTINVLRSAISSAHVHVDSKPIGQHPLVVRLMRGVSICRPPQPRYQHTWNVAMVTEYLSRLGGNDNLSEKQLAQKLCMLMALTCPERSSILASLNIKYLKYFPEGVKFQHTIFRKRSHNGKLGESVFPKFADTLLCPVACLSTYLDRTKKWRKDKTDIMQQNLFLSFKKPHKPVTSATLSRWLKEVIRQSGIKDIFGGHSVRSASTSTAKKAGLSIDIILDMADWTSPSTFNLFYYKPTLPVSYGTSVLSQK